MREREREENGSRRKNCIVKKRQNKKSIKSVPKAYYDGLKNRGEILTHHQIIKKSFKEAREIQSDNNLSKIKSHDEYYTRYCDVEEMCDEFAHQFEDKVVFCNCDDSLSEDDKQCSAFALYFKKNFKKLKLKKIDLFTF